MHHKPGKRIDNYPCTTCGGKSKRDLAGDFETVNMTRSTPISNSTTIRGSYAHTTEYAFGKHKTNPDGSVDPSQRPFRDSGELNKYMNGGNELGKPILGDNGQPLRRADGSIVRKGAKLFQYGPNATPSQTGIRKRDIRVPDTSVDFSTVRDAVGRSSYFDGAPVHRSPQRRAR